MKLEPRLESEPEQFFEHVTCCLNCVIYVFYKSMCQVLIVMLGLTLQQGIGIGPTLIINVRHI